MSQRITFIDTSVLVNIVPVPGRDQHRAQVLEEFRERYTATEQFILPITSVIETGNHIAQLATGDRRRSAAHRFSEILEQVIEGRLPFVLHDVAWGSDFLRRLVDGSTSEIPLVEHATQGVGTGDLCILTEREMYQRRLGATADVQIWTLDQGLHAHS
jgi:hypothetical protein